MKAVKMGILERIKEIEQEMDKTQKNKATEGHLGMLKARLAKLRSELLTPSSGGGGGQVCCTPAEHSNRFAAKHSRHDVYCGCGRDAGNLSAGEARSGHAY